MLCTVSSKRQFGSCDLQVVVVCTVDLKICVSCSDLTELCFQRSTTLPYIVAISAKGCQVLHLPPRRVLQPYLQPRRTALANEPNTWASQLENRRAKVSRC